jgi:Cd(II)/Pb(II)-responsive transcriptional regulator
MKIGALAKKLNCSVETIRYYEKIGLIPPSTRDRNNNYRHYNQTHLDQLTFVRHCRALSMSQVEIIELLSARQSQHKNCQSIDQIIDNHLQHVSARIEQFQALKHQLMRLRNQCKALGNSQECGIIQDLNKPLSNELKNVKDNNHILGSH